MSRCPFQILAFPFIRKENKISDYCVFKRTDELYWQGIAGGGEESESPFEAARREIYEESGIATSNQLFCLETVSSLPVCYFSDRKLWGKNKYVIPNYCFAVEVFSHHIVLSDEHLEYKWVNYQQGKELLDWDDNKTALWELNERLKNNDLVYPIRS